MAWSLQPRAAKQSAQLSFIGGKPRLPAGESVPTCQLCGSPLTFFFQIAMPKGSMWEGSTLAVYQCTKCADENHLIPEMLRSTLRGADIPYGFLARYQRNFAFLVFPTDQGEIVYGYEESLLFSEIQLQKGSTLGSFGKLGGTPHWLLEDESPATYGGSYPMQFLLEVSFEFQFKMTANADPQIGLGLTGEPEPSQDDYYELFIDAQRVGKDALLDFSSKGPLSSIPLQGTISAINVRTADGWVRINGR